jgi:hypothetical protein
LLPHSFFDERNDPITHLQMNAGRIVMDDVKAKPPDSAGASRNADF